MYKLHILANFPDNTTSEYDYGDSMNLGTLHNAISITISSNPKVTSFVFTVVCIHEGAGSLD